MDEAQEDVNQDGGNAVTEEVEEAPGTTDGSQDPDAREEAGKDDPYSIKKRLAMQAKRHQREMRAMQEQLMHMQGQMGGQSSSNPNANQTNPYPSPGQPNQPSGSEEERIHRAVRYALDAKDNEERQAKDAERQAHVQKQYMRLQDEFDRASEKYEDFDDVVKAHDVPFSPAIRDALLLVDNPADVAYKLGKNRSELKRITDLHPLDQAREVNKLAFALMGGNNGKASPTKRSDPMNPMKANPATNSSAVTDKTPASAIRARMKAGTWK